MSAARVGVRLRAQVLADAGRRCGYCRVSEEITGAPLEIDHLLPEVAGGPTWRDNLWAACRQCNAFKGRQMQARDPLTDDVVPLFNPRHQVWPEHFMSPTVS